jgi:saccharopine dehydrogenase-like NADP-dependent oxidoreductase
MTIAVLGAGMVGSAIALDLAQQYNIIAFDANSDRLDALHAKNKRIQTQAQDLANYTAYRKMLQPADLVVSAVPGFMGFNTLKAVIESGKNVVDISFFSEDALQLDALAKERKVTAIVDCGVAPGMSNYIIGRYDKEMKLNAFEIYVGGLPQRPEPPFFYKAPFSPVDVIEEYTRPARLKQNGKEITKPALSDREILNFDHLGPLEAFNTDGLRSLLTTMAHIPNQIEKTIRYPGHADMVQVLKNSGFFSKEKIEVDGVALTPLDFTSKILIKDWKLDPLEEELTVMKVTLKSKEKTIEYYLLDHYDRESQTSSMARSTGYTCTASVNLILNNLFNRKGVFPPELIGGDQKCFDYVLSYLMERNVKWIKKEYSQP